MSVYLQKVTHRGITSAAETRQTNGRKVEVCTKVFVLRIGCRVAVSALLLALWSVLRTLTGWTSSIHVMLAGSDAVGLAACRTRVSVSSDFNATTKSISLQTHRLWSRTVLL